MTLAFGDLAKKAMLVRIGKRVCTCTCFWLEKVGCLARQKRITWLLGRVGGCNPEENKNHVSGAQSRRLHTHTALAAAWFSSAKASVAARQSTSARLPCILDKDLVCVCAGSSAEDRCGSVRKLPDWAYGWLSRPVWRVMSSTGVGGADYLDVALTSRPQSMQNSNLPPPPLAR